MRKVFFIMMFAIAGSFGIASAQVEQATPQNSGTTNSNQSTSPNTQTKKQGTYQNQGTYTTTPQGINEKQGTMNQTQGAMSQDEKGWTKIGEKTVNMSKDREEIAVTGAEKFSSIKIKVPEDAMVELKDVVVEYEGGTKQNVDMSKMSKSTIENSTSDESKVIELNSSDRNVKKISFTYEPRDSKGAMSTSSSKGTMSNSDGTMSSSKGSMSNSDGTMSSSKGSMSNSDGTMSSSKGKMHSSKGKMHSSTDNDRQGTSENTKGTMGTKSSKAKIEVWGLKSDTALK